jgi:hypothetical protein
MSTGNWDSIDTDIELTRKRWENHISGRLPFDTANNSTRGLETMLDLSHTELGLASKHSYNIIQESNRQKREDEYIHWQKLRDVSLQTSVKEIDRARRLALDDAEEAVACWRTDTAQDPATPDVAKKGNKPRFLQIFTRRAKAKH